MAGRYHLAQVNIAIGRAPLDDPCMADFVARLDSLNALADSAAGFVWRLQSEEADALAIEVFDNPRILFNLTLWETVEALEAYVYKSDHVNAVRKRLQWFERLNQPPLTLWWVKEGHFPTVREAKQRLDSLRHNGPTAEAFNFRHRFPSPEAGDA